MHACYLLFAKGKMMNKIAAIMAASRGIGAACAAELAARGYKLVLMSRSADIHSVAQELGGIAEVGRGAE